MNFFRIFLGISIILLVASLILLPFGVLYAHLFYRSINPVTLGLAIGVPSGAILVFVLIMMFIGGQQIHREPEYILERTIIRKLTKLTKEKNGDFYIEEQNLNKIRPLDKWFPTNSCVGVIIFFLFNPIFLGLFSFGMTLAAFELRGLAYSQSRVITYILDNFLKGGLADLMESYNLGLPESVDDFYLNTLSFFIRTFVSVIIISSALQVYSVVSKVRWAGKRLRSVIRLRQRQIVLDDIKSSYSVEVSARRFAPRELFPVISPRIAYFSDLAGKSLRRTATAEEEANYNEISLQKKAAEKFFDNVIYPVLDQDEMHSKRQKNHRTTA